MKFYPHGSSIKCACHTTFSVENDQVPFYDRLQDRCDELAAQLYAMETKCQNLQRERDFYIKLFEVGVDPILSNV